MTSKYPKRNTLLKVDKTGRFYLTRYSKYIEVCFKMIIFKRGIITRKYDISKIERIYVEDIKHFIIYVMRTLWK